eukprot:754973-Hanusia_phi.AAC.4
MQLMRGRRREKEGEREKEAEGRKQRLKEGLFIDLEHEQEAKISQPPCKLQRKKFHLQLFLAEDFRGKKEGENMKCQQRNGGKKEGRSKKEG